MRPSSPSIRNGITLIEVIVVISIIAVLIGLVLPSVHKARAAADRTACSNNLRQIGIGLAGYQASFGKLPPGMSLNKKAGGEQFPYMSWECRILPYVEQESVWQQAVAAYQVNHGYLQWEHWPHPIATVIPVFGCPSDSRVSSAGLAAGRFPAAFTSYVGVSGIRTSDQEGVLFLNSGIRLTEIYDGTSNTLMVGERPPSGDLWFGWWYAGYGCDEAGMADMVLGVRDAGSGCAYALTGCSAQPAGFGPGKVGNNCDALHFWSLHPGGANFLFCDGSIRFLRYSADPIMPMLATRRGGENVAVPD